MSINATIESLTEDESKIVDELYNWMKSKELTAERAIRILSRTKDVVCEARSAAAQKAML